MKKIYLVFTFALLQATFIIAQQADFSGITEGHIFCHEADEVPLTAENNFTGTFSGPGVTDNGNGTASFDPTSAGEGTHSINYTVTEIDEYVQISSGSFHTTALKTDGTLWAWGWNENGQLGDGTTIDRHRPIQIGTETDWQSISTTGYSNTIALKADGTLWVWGRNDIGQLGDGTTTDKHTPVQIGTDTDWQSISVGYFHTIALKADGTLWAWGWNSHGQLGDGTTTDKHTPVQIGTDTDWQNISTEHRHSIALKTNGTLWAWGWNEFGQLGDGTTTDKHSPVQVGTDNNWQSIHAGGVHTITLKTDGTLWVWGRNNFGQLGDGTTTNRHSPVQVGTDTDWQSISVGHFHTIALKADRTLWAWGRNYHGQLGDGTITNRHSPIQIGTDTDWQSISAGWLHTIALKADGTLWAWGDNSGGKLGDGTTTSRYNPVLISNIIQTTITVSVEDVTAPVADISTLPDVTAECEVTNLTAPTATDNCEGEITGAHNATFPITATTLVTWTYDDGNGNTATQEQNVVINDVIAPVADIAILSDVTAECEVTSLTAPTATDNCTGIITGTHNATFPITETTLVTWTYKDENGNTTTQEQNVVITTSIDNGITQVDAFTLSADATGYNYQWIDCDNGNAPIAGETNQTFTATTNGNYAVIVDNGTCNVTSDCMAITTVGINEIEKTDYIKIYPNPTNNILNFETSGVKITSIVVMDITGKAVKTLSAEASIINVSQLVNGVYFLQLHTDKGTTTKKFVKK